MYHHAKVCTALLKWLHAPSSLFDFGEWARRLLRSPPKLPTPRCPKAPKTVNKRDLPSHSCSPLCPPPPAPLQPPPRALPSTTRISPPPSSMPCTRRNRWCGHICRPPPVPRTAPYSRSWRNLRTSWMSFGMIVTHFLAKVAC